MLFTSHNTPHIPLGNEQCLKLLLGVCNTKKWVTLSLWFVVLAEWWKQNYLLNELHAKFYFLFKGF
jgi:hypothetical protein